MVSTPWMKGVAETIADPIEPVCPEDVRPSVKDLIEEHRSKIDKIRGAIAAESPLYDPTKHDDLWILRFWLSHKKQSSTKAAIQAALHTLKFRAEHKLDDEDIRHVKLHQMPDGPVKEYWDVRSPGDSLLLTIPDEKRGVVCFLRLGGFTPGASNRLSKEVWEWAFIYTSEWSFQWLDYVTRTTGRLTKQVRFVDLTGISVSSFSRKDMKYDGDVMAQMEDVYPQLLESIKVCNAPSFIHIIWALARTVMPKRILEKFDMVNPIENRKERETLFKFISEEKLPVSFGGPNTVPPFEWDC